MTMVTSGQISVGDIITEKGGSPIAGGNYSLQSQSTTNINSLSTYKPDGIVPHALSEFYRYNHSQTTTLPPTTAAPGTTTTTTSTTTAAPTTLPPGITSTTVAPTTTTTTTTTVPPTTTLAPTTLAPTTTTTTRAPTTTTTTTTTTSTSTTTTTTTTTTIPPPPTTTTTTAAPTCWSVKYNVSPVQTSSVNACAQGGVAQWLYKMGPETYFDTNCTVPASNGYYGDGAGVKWYRVNGEGGSLTSGNC